MDIRSLKNVNAEKFPAVIWDWCSKPTAEEIDLSLQRFSELCISAVYLRPSKGLVQKYLSEDFFELVRTAARRSAKYGLKLYIFDENGECSGCGGDEIISVSDYRMKDILKAESIEKNDIVLDENEKAVLRDMSSVRGSGRSAIADISDDFVVGCFEETVYDAYLKNCTRFIGYEISGFVSHISLPEAPVFSKQAALISGDEKSVCSALLSEKVGALHLKNTYFENMSRLVSEGFTKHIKGKCREMNTEYAVSVSGNKKISRQLAYIQADTPLVFVDGEEADITEIKLAATICAQFGKKSVFAIKEPSYSKCFNIQNAAFMCAAFGADSVCFDSVAMSLTDRRKYEKSNIILSPHVQKNISAQISRLCTISGSIQDEAEILLIYPQTSINCDEKGVYENFSELVTKLAACGINFHIAEECVIEKYAQADENGVSIGNIKYKTLLFPDAPLFSEHTAVVAGKVSDVWAIGKSSSFLNVNEKTFEDVRETFGFSETEIKGRCYVNRRIDEKCEYVFVTALEDIVVSGRENLFVFAPENGEIYALPTDGEFLLRKGKTAALITSENISYDDAPPLAGGLEIRKSEKICDALFSITESDENIYVLRTVSALFGKKAYRETPIDDLHKAFYALQDGESVSAKYVFYAEEGIGKVFAHFENAQFYDVIEINGSPIENLKVSKRDLRIFSAEITDMISVGKNTIHVEFKKCNNYNPDFTSRAPAYYGVYNLTSFEPVYLSGDFDCNGGALAACGEYGENVSDGPMPDYYGALTYAVRLPDGELRDCLLAVDGEFDVCRIRIGRRESVYTSSPLMELFNIDSSALCEVTIYNTAKNLFASYNDKREPFGIRNIEIRKFV